jgi:hypothetical protein
MVLALFPVLSVIPNQFSGEKALCPVPESFHKTGETLFASHPFGVGSAAPPRASPGWNGV